MNFEGLLLALELLLYRLPYRARLPFKVKIVLYIFFHFVLETFRTFKVNF
jgi:hypothetical protein